MPPPLEDAIWYLETQRVLIGSYEQWQQQGYLVGSGLVERAIAVVINMRMKKTGHAMETCQCHRCCGFTRPAHQC